jgi:anti-sigma factor RsiW
VSSVERPTEEELQAYVDGRLGTERRAAVEAYLFSNPAVAARIRSYREAQRELQDVFRSKAEEPIPRRLRVVTIEAELRQARMTRFRLAAAACFCLVFGFFAGLSTNRIGDLNIPLIGASMQAQAALKYDAISAHRFLSTKGPADAVLTAPEAQLQRWLLRRLGAPFKVPDLSEFGMHFMGGQILPYKQDNAVALLLYGDDQGGRVTIYLRAGEHGDTRLRSAQLDDTLIFYWFDDRCGYVIAAAPELGRLSNIAKAVHDYFEPPKPNGQPL